MHGVFLDLGGGFEEESLLRRSFVKNDIGDGGFAASANQVSIRKLTTRHTKRTCAVPSGASVACFDGVDGPSLQVTAIQEVVVRKLKFVCL